MTLPIVHDGDDVASSLSEAWNDRASLLIAPRKHVGLDLEAWRALVPADLQQDHFALWTSGTTGEAKLIIGAKRRAERLARVLHEEQDNEPCASAICVLPLSYSFALVNQWLWSRTLGRTLHMVGFAAPARLLHTLSEVEDSLLCLVSAQVRMLQAMAGSLTFSKVRRVHFAGARFPQAELPSLRHLFPRAIIFNNYGCAEALPRLTLRRSDAAADAAHVGWPIAGVSLRIDEEKRVMFHSPYACVAVIEGGRVARVAADAWLPSGDLGELTDDGALRLLGRSAHVIKRFGEKVPVDHYTAQLAVAARVSATSYLEHDAQGEAGYVVVLSPPPSPEDLASAQQWLRKELPRPHWPLRLEASAEVPVTHHGKADHAALRQRANAVLWSQKISLGGK